MKTWNKKLTTTEEGSRRLGIGIELGIVFVREERNELLRDVASRFASVRRTRGFVYDLSRHGRLSARPTFSSHLAAFFSRCRTSRAGKSVGCQAASGIGCALAIAF